MARERSGRATSHAAAGWLPASGWEWTMLLSGVGFLGGTTAVGVATGNACGFWSWFAWWLFGG